jgi:hypothetical protein
MLRTMHLPLRPHSDHKDHCRSTLPSRQITFRTNSNAGGEGATGSAIQCRRNVPDVQHVVRITKNAVASPTAGALSQRSAHVFKKPKVYQHSHFVPPTRLGVSCSLFTDSNFYAGQLRKHSGSNRAHLALSIPRLDDFEVDKVTSSNRWWRLPWRKPVAEEHLFICVKTETTT